MSKDALNTLRAIQSLASADLSQTSDDEIRSEIAQSGKDPDALASEIADRLDNITAEFMRQQVAAAQGDDGLAHIKVSLSDDAAKGAKPDA